MRILLVEDDPSTAQAITTMLRKEDWVIDSTDMGEDGLDLGKIYDYDLIILDLMLPDMDGMDVIRQLRAGKIATPVLILSGLQEADKKVQGFGVGADDYLTKPFNREELVARIQAIVRRSKGHAQPKVQVGRLTVNLEARTAEVDAQSAAAAPPFISPTNSE